jgi:L-aspartate oxidase
MIAQDVLIIGSGAAGLTAALHLAPHCQVGLISKAGVNAGSSWQAQGGIAAVLAPEDSVDAHVKDTLAAGAGLCHRSIVELCVSKSAASIQWLLEQGVQFSQQSDHQVKSGFHLTREGGHSQRRIIHVADATGKAVIKTLVQRVQEQRNISLYSEHMAVDLITREKADLPGRGCVGAYVLNLATHQVQAFTAKAVIIATGGASKAYLYTSNTDGASGDGIAMAWRAGCSVVNMEFNQFHPTCLYHPKAKNFLITEAIRGEGGQLQLPNGEPFMQRFDHRGELAPRDIVARAIDHEMKRLGADHLYLDISHKSRAFIEQHFPGIYQRCLRFGIDISQQPIPIVPAAHYTCGGVQVDSCGASQVPQLYVVGEAACTGLHGANRMASNSLLECLVFGQLASEHILQRLAQWTLVEQVPAWDDSQVTDSDEDVVISHNWHELRQFMWNYMGIVRTNKRLTRAANRIGLLQQEINEFYRHYKISPHLLELRNLALVAELMVTSAQLRKESRGLHYTLDYPNLLRVARDTLLRPNVSLN